MMNKDCSGLKEELTVIANILWDVWDVLSFYNE